MIAAEPAALTCLYYKDYYNGLNNQKGKVGYKQKGYGKGFQGKGFYAMIAPTATCG